MDKETAEQLRTTKALYDDGVLTEEEYNAKKAELLHAPAVVAAQPPTNEHGGVVQGHVVTEQPQKVHPEPRPQEDILAKRCECERRCECGIRPERPTKKDGKPDYGFRWDGEVQKWVSNHRSNEESARAATRIQAKARQSAAWKDFPLPPGATSATSLQGWWFGPGPIGLFCCGGVGEGGCGFIAFPIGCPFWCLKFEARGHNRLLMTNQCGCPSDTFYTRECDSKKQNRFGGKEGEDEKQIIIHNSICATHTCAGGGDDGKGGGACWGCITPLMCHISSGAMRTAWANRYGSADVATATADEALALSWFYRDPQGAVQGPFEATQMREWFQAGHFDDDLPLRQGSNGDFHSLKLLFANPPGDAFVTEPKDPSITVQPGLAVPPGEQEQV